jgi:RimJ/RimL family protein N-acetyltransferase
VHSYAADADVVRYVEWGPNTEADSKNFVERVIELGRVSPRVDFELAVISARENELVGAASIHISNALNREGWIGYCLNKRFWGQGIATEAATALIAFGFAQLGLHRIFATVDPANAASARILQKLGMSYEGQLRSHKLVRSSWRNTDMYAVIESDLREPE